MSPGDGLLSHRVHWTVLNCVLKKVEMGASGSHL
jgi:hypothetical protein